MTAAPRITPEQAIDWGLTPLPLRATGDTKAPRPRRWECETFDPKDWREGEGTGLRCGRQADGTFLSIADFDHKPEQNIDAPAQFAAALARTPESLRPRLFTAYSTSRRGRYIAFRALRPLPKAWLRDEDGRRIGDFLGEGAQVVAPTPDRWIAGTLASIPLLTDGELDTMLTALNYGTRPDGITRQGDRILATIDDQELAHWLGNVDAIMRRIQPGKPTYQTLQSDGGPDRSAARYGVACNLRKYWGLPNVEIAAVLLTCCDWGHSEVKGSDWLYADVRCCIAHAEEKYPHAIINPTRLRHARPPVTLPEVPRKSRGRPRTRPLDSFYQALVDEADCGHVMQTQKQLAARFRVSVQTIGRWEKALAGKVKRYRTADKQSSYLAILRPIINTDAAETVAAAAADSPSEVLSKIPAGTIDARAHEEVHTVYQETPEVLSPDPQPQAAAATYPAVAEAMREAFAAVDGARRITRRRIRDYLEANYPGAPWSAAALCYWYGRELQRRRREREHDRLLASLPSMPQAKLRRLERWCERRLEEGPNGQHGQQYYQARWLAPHVAQELERPARRAALERTKVRRGRPAPAQTLTNDDAMALFNRTEQSDPRTPEPAAAPPAAVCTPLPVGPTVPTFEPVEPKPAAAASCSQTIVRPDLYRRYAAERRAAAVHQ